MRQTFWILRDIIYEWPLISLASYSVARLCSRWMGSNERRQTDRPVALESHVCRHQRGPRCQRQPEGGEASDAKHGVWNDETDAGFPYPSSQERREPLWQGKFDRTSQLNLAVPGRMSVLSDSTCNCNQTKLNIILPRKSPCPLHLPRSGLPWPSSAPSTWSQINHFKSYQNLET